MDRKNTTVTVVNVHEFDSGFPGSSLTEFAGWFSDQVEKIPLEYLDSAKIEFAGHIGYDEPYSSIEITYQRPETDEEFSIHEKQVQYLKNIKEKEDRALLRKLLEKYG